MQNSNIKCRAWAIGIYLYTTNIKGISSMRLHRELGIGQKAAWFMLHRLRKAQEAGSMGFSGPVEVDEAYFGGKRKSMSNAKRKALKGTGRGAVGKTVVVGIKDRETNEVRAKVVKDTDKPTLQGFVSNHTDPDATVYTDDATAYHGLPFNHETVRHSISEYVRDQAHTNGIESFWALLKRGYHGTYHHMSEKHLNRYVDEFSGRHNARGFDTIQQMEGIVSKMQGKRLSYNDLTR